MFGSASGWGPGGYHPDMPWPARVGSSGRYGYEAGGSRSLPTIAAPPRMAAPFRKSRRLNSLEAMLSYNWVAIICIAHSAARAEFATFQRTLHPFHIEPFWDDLMRPFFLELIRDRLSGIAEHLFKKRQNL